MTLPDLDRMEIEDTAGRPERLAAAVHRQLGEVPPPIDVHAIARALDIYEIREEPLRNLEGCLQTDAERSEGIILLNCASSYFRRRYTLGHELGHFLCFWHEGDQGMFSCSRRDMTVPTGAAARQRQETEANRFAIELLAPPRLLRSRLRRLPDLEHVSAISAQLHISRAAAARRYVDLHEAELAVVFVKDDRFVYAHRRVGFPWLGLGDRDRLPVLPTASLDDPLSEMTEVDVSDWLRTGHPGSLAAQVLQQADGHSMILLHYEREDI